MLILKLAFAFALNVSSKVQSPVIKHHCSVWKHGISWLKDGFQIIVKIRVHWVSLIIKCEDTMEVRIKCADIMNELIKVICGTREEFCPALNMTEYLIAPKIVLITQ